jgi:hypothetical protein
MQKHNTMNDFSFSNNRFRGMNDYVFICVYSVVNIN